MTPSSTTIVESTSKPSSSTPLRQRSYDISVNKTNDIHPDLNQRANKNAGDSVSGLSGADVLAFANIEESSSKTSVPFNQTIDDGPMNGNNNNSLKALTDWTHIIKTMESSTENDNEVTSMLNESRADVIPNLKLSTSGTVPAFSPLPTEAPTKSSPIPLTITNSVIMSSTTERPSTIFNKNLLTIGEVYRKKSESMATMRPSNRIDVHEYYRTETPPFITTIPTTATEETPTTTINWMTTNLDKRNTDAELIETTLVTTDVPQTSTTISRRQNYRFTTLSPMTVTNFVTIIPPGQETTTTFTNIADEITTELSESTTVPTTSSSKIWVVPTTIKSTSTSFQEPTQQWTIDSTVSSSSTKDIVSTEVVTKIPKTGGSHVITTQTIATDNDNIWVVTDESTTPFSTFSTTSTSTVASTMSEEIGSTEAPGTDVTAIVVISLSVVGVVAFLLLMGFLVSELRKIFFAREEK